MREKPSAPVQVRWHCLVIGAAADKAARRSITISYLHPSSSLHQRPKASATTDAALITTCSCFDCLRVALFPPTPPPLHPRQLLNLECLADCFWFSTFPPRCLCSRCGVQSLLTLVLRKRAHKGDVTRHMRRGLAALLYLHIAASLVVVVVMQVAFVWREPRREQCRLNLVNPARRGCRAKSFDCVDLFAWIKRNFWGSQIRPPLFRTLGDVLFVPVLCNKALMLPRVYKGEPVPLISDEACRI